MGRVTRKCSKSKVRIGSSRSSARAITVASTRPIPRSAKPASISTARRRGRVEGKTTVCSPCAIAERNARAAVAETRARRS